MNRSERRRRTRVIIKRRYRFMRDMNMLCDQWTIHTGGNVYSIQEWYGISDVEWDRKKARQRGMCRKKTPLDCDCSMCSNPRAWMGDTRQEILAKINFNEQMDEINWSPYPLKP